MSRQEEVDDFLSCGHIWPPTVEAAPNHPFIKALRAVLLRLPEEVPVSFIQFIVEAHEALAFNVLFERVYQGNCTNPKFRLDTIVIYQRSFGLSHEALVALIAHEIAHSVVQKNKHRENEDAADELVISWGFSKELAELRKEKQCSTKRRPPRGGVDYVFCEKTWCFSQNIVDNEMKLRYYKT